MMNKIISFAAALLICVLALSLASCGSADGTTTATQTNILDPEMGVETRGTSGAPVEPTNAPATSAKPTTQAEPTTSAELTSIPDIEDMDYEMYSNLTSEQQYEFFLKFSDPGAFLLWFNEQKDLYEAQHPIVVVEPGETIDIGY